MSDSTAITAALGAALIFGISTVVDQRSTKRVKRRAPTSPKIFLDLLRQPLWFASIAGTLAGFGLQVLALRFGPLALVEPILVCNLIFAVLINSTLRKAWDPKLIAGVVATVAGVGGFLAVARPSAGNTSVSFLVVLPLAAGLAAGICGCLVVARRSDSLRPLALALACGINYGVAAFLVKIVVSPHHGGLVGILTNWPIYALAIVGPLGYLFNETSFQQGALIAPVLSIITVCDPLISIALAYLWLNERLASSPAAITGEILFLILMVLGIVSVADRAPHVTQQIAQRSLPGQPVLFGPASAGGPAEGVEHGDRVEVVPPVDDLAVAEGQDGDVAVPVRGSGGYDLARGCVLQDDCALGRVVVHGQVVAAVEDDSVAVGPV